jgi:hypothetical protein
MTVPEGTVKALAEADEPLEAAGRVLAAAVTLDLAGEDDEAVSLATKSIPETSETL